MTNKHNKKRNIGIIYELLLKYISKSLIESDKKEAKKATLIIEKYFKKDTELYKEFRLFNALLKGKVSDTHVAASILTEAKNISKNLNNKKIDDEKSKLIRDINYTLKPDFYYSTIENYRELGTIQMALNEWRKEEKDIKRLIEYESAIAKLMLSDEKQVMIKEQLDVSHTDTLVLKIMTEKFNKKYGEDLTKDQKTIVENYVFYSGKNDDYLKTFLDNKINEAIKNLNEFKTESENVYLLKKVNEVKDKVTLLKKEEINDASIVKFLTVTRLIDELRKGM